MADADVAQLVEHHLAKVRVAGSSPVVRSNESAGERHFRSARAGSADGAHHGCTTSAPHRAGGRLTGLAKPLGRNPPAPISRTFRDGIQRGGVPMTRNAGVVRRLLVGVALASGLVVMSAGGAAAKVHGVSQAGCANNPAISGGNQSGTNSPNAPIPVTSSSTGEAASDGKASAGSGGDGDPACDTAATGVRQDQ
jgi:hypothetical protein